jgi:MFS family permease
MLDWPVAIGIAAAGLASLAIRWLLFRSFLDHRLTRFGASLAFAIAFAVGLAIATKLELLWPQRHWHWLPWLTLLAAIVGAFGASEKRPSGARKAVLLLTVAACALLLVPAWPDLKPGRPIAIALLTGYLFLLAISFESLASRMSAPHLLAQTTLASAGLCMLVLVYFSVSYAGLVGVSTAALAGGWLSTVLQRENHLLSAFSLVYAVNIGGWAFIACVTPRPPLGGMLIAPLAPLSLWCCTRGPLSRLNGIAAAAVHSLLVLALLAIAVIALTAQIGNPFAGM